MTNTRTDIHRPVHKMTDAELEAESEYWQDRPYVSSEEDDKRWQAVERELDARALWNHSDARVRESVGNYGPESS